MDTESALQSLQISLTDAIEKWIEYTSEREQWDVVGYTPPELARLMSESAMQVIRVGAAVQNYLEREAVDFSEK